MHLLQTAANVPESSAELLGSPHLAIRQLVPADEPDVTALLKRLEPQARRDRFGEDISDVALEHYARQSFATSPAIFGASIDGRLAGIAEITRLAADSAAVLAFVVDAVWRRQGIGCRLLLTALAWAARHDMCSVQLRCARTNWAVRQIAQKANARLSLTSGEFLAEFDPRLDFAQIGHTQQ